MNVHASAASDPHRPGQMTATMRAVDSTAEHRALRVALVREGSIVQELLLDRSGAVTVGTGKAATLLVVGPELPPCFELLSQQASRIVLRWRPGMSGRVHLGGESVELGRLETSARAGAAGVFELGLDLRSRGAVRLGDATVLFQVLRRPPSLARPGLPRWMVGGPLRTVDRFTTVVAALSFALHFALVALVYSEWGDPVVDDSIVVRAVVESLAGLPAPAALATRQPSEASATEATSAEATSQQQRDGAGRPSKGTGRSRAAAAAAGRGRELDGRVLDIANELAAADIATVAALGSDGIATQGVLDEGQTPARWLDDLAASGRGSRQGNDFGLDLASDSEGGLPPGSRRGLNDIVATERASDERGQAPTVDGPRRRGTAQTGTPSVTGELPNAPGVVAGLRAQFRNCYQRKLPQHPEMQGSTLLVARIGSNGEVLSVGGGGGQLTPIVPCLKAVVGGAQFSAPRSGAAVLQIPITFRLQK